MTTRREFIQKAGLLTTGLALSTSSMKASSYRKILGANDRVRVGIVGFSDRFRNTLAKNFMNHAKELNFELMGVSDIWNRRRDEANDFLTSRGWAASEFVKARNNDELFERKDVDAVIISTADFQHALHCAAAVNAGKDVYVEKPFAETLEDAKIALAAVEKSSRIVQVGSQRRSSPKYWSAEEYIKSGKFGDITTVEMTWNINQPGRWRRPELVEQLRQKDTDWDRFLMNRPKVAWNPRYYLEFRLFHPYSSGIPGQWMAHQIDTVHWFSNLEAPRSVVANGGIYTWKDGRTNADTFTAVFDYGPFNDTKSGFQVIYSFRFNNAAGGVKEYYYSNAGMINLDTNQITPTGGLSIDDAKKMGLSAKLLQPAELAASEKIETGADTGSDSSTSLHLRNWMECIRSRKQPNAPAKAGFSHSVANIMATTALYSGKKVTWDSSKKEIILS